eukprot:gene4250-4546_t
MGIGSLRTLRELQRASKLEKSFCLVLVGLFSLTMLSKVPSLRVVALGSTLLACLGTCLNLSEAGCLSCLNKALLSWCGVVTTNAAILALAILAMACTGSMHAVPMPKAIWSFIWASVVSCPIAYLWVWRSVPCKLAGVADVHNTVMSLEEPPPTDIADLELVCAPDWRTIVPNGIVSLCLKPIDVSLLIDYTSIFYDPCAGFASLYASKLCDRTHSQTHGVTRVKTEDQDCRTSHLQDNYGHIRHMQAVKVKSEYFPEPRPYPM